MVLVKKIAIINHIVHVMRAMVAHDVKHKLVCSKRARTFSSSGDGDSSSSSNSSSFSFLLAFVCFYSVRNDATITHNRLPLVYRVVHIEERRRSRRRRRRKKKKKTRKLRHIFHRHACGPMYKYFGTSINHFFYKKKVAVNLILSSSSSSLFFNVRHIYMYVAGLEERNF